MTGQISLKPVAPAEAIQYFRQKGYRIGFDFRDVWQQEHQAAFTVAKAMQVDLLAEIRAGVDAALTDGTTFKTFQDAVTPRLVARGWWGRQEMTDPQTGETRPVQLGSPKRLQVIFDTNLATAYAEGQWERIQRNKAIFTHLEYVKSASENPRLEHLAYAGLTLPVDDPFWQAHMPVRAWGCKCTVIQHTRRTMAREGLTEGKAPPEVMRTVVNKRSGEIMSVPAGVDPAFNYPPGGRRAQLGRMLMDKANATNAGLASQVLSGAPAKTWLPLVRAEFGEFVGRYAAGERRELGDRRTVGVISPAVLTNLARLVGVTPPGAGLTVMADALHKLLGRDRAPDRQARNPNQAALADLPAALANPRSVWWDPTDGTALVYLAESPNDGRLMKVAVRVGQAVKSGQVNVVRSVIYVDRKTLTTQGWVRLDALEAAK